VALGRTPDRGRFLTGRVLLVLALLVGLVLAGREAGSLLPRFAGWVAAHGPAGALLFVLGYVIAAVAFVPGSLLTLAAGAIFGIAKGTLLVFIAATLGASAAFLVSRYLARSLVERRLAGNQRFAAIDRAIGREGRKIVFLLRLSPVFPYNLLNYALGLTTVSFRDYVAASVGMLPATLLYVYYGKVAGDVARVASGHPVPRGLAYYLLLGLGLVATIVVTALVTRIARRSLQQATSTAGDTH
jgi:uncharacterized membrane protein YdjX (TVP38/TMEM64 family)